MIEQLLGDISPSSFVQDHYLKFPFTSAGGVGRFTSLGSWETVRAILAERDVDVMVVRRGELVERATPPSYDEAREFHASGCTLVIRNSEKHHPRLAELAAGFRDDFQARVDVHIYCTPAGQFGFGWHYDAEDVFILQTLGSKEYSLRKNTVHPWPLVETIPRDMHYEREIMPLMRCTLAAGDWLYIPTGFWHRALSADPGMESISLAVGVMSTSAIDVLDFLRSRLVCSLLWRQRLAIPGKASATDTTQLVEQYRTVFAQLGDDLARAMCDGKFLHDFLASKGRDTSAINVAQQNGRSGQATRRVQDVVPHETLAEAQP